MAVGVAVLLTGCSSGSSVDPGPVTGTTVATSVISPAPTPEVPTLPAGARAATPEGATAFVQYWWAVFNYSHRSGSSTLLRSLSAPTCRFCLTAANEVDQRASDGSTFQGYNVKVVAAVTAGGNDPRNGLTTNTMLDLSAAQVVRADGSTATTYPARPNLPSDVGLVWEGSSWKILDVVVNPKRTP